MAESVGEESLSLWYLGIDVAGASNTWAVGLRREAGGATVGWGPALRSLTDIVDWARSNNVLAVAIDAPLTASITDESGFRPCDLAMRDALSTAALKTWVASLNSLMAVPVRGQMLAEALAPYVGTILETHPRYALWAVLDGMAADELASYKATREPSDAVRTLSAEWMLRFGVRPPNEIAIEGALDAVVAATVGMLYHRNPEQLEWPTDPSVVKADVRGIGRFTVPDRRHFTRAST